MSPVSLSDNLCLHQVYVSTFIWFLIEERLVLPLWCQCLIQPSDRAFVLMELSH